MRYLIFSIAVMLSLSVSAQISNYKFDDQNGIATFSATPIDTNQTLLVAVYNRTYPMTTVQSLHVGNGVYKVYNDPIFKTASNLDKALNVKGSWVETSILTFNNK